MCVYVCVYRCAQQSLLIDDDMLTPTGYPPIHTHQPTRPTAHYFRLVLKTSCIVNAPRPTWTHLVSYVLLYTHHTVSTASSQPEKQRVGSALAFKRHSFASKLLCTSESSLSCPFPSALPTLLQYYWTTIARYTTFPQPAFCTPYTIQSWYWQYPAKAK